MARKRYKLTINGGAAARKLHEILVLYCGLEVGNTGINDQYAVMDVVVTSDKDPRFANAANLLVEAQQLMEQRGWGGYNITCEEIVKRETYPVRFIFCHSDYSWCLHTHYVPWEIAPADAAAWMREHVADTPFTVSGVLYVRVAEYLQFSPGDVS